MLSMHRSRGALRPAVAGFTVVELLVAAVIFVIVTGLAGIYLVRQTTYTQRTQAQADTQANLRLAMEMMGADLFNAGSQGVALRCSWTGNPLRVTVPSGTGPAGYRASITELRYCSSYGDGAINATYQIAADATLGGIPSLWRSGAPAVPGIVALEVDVECASGGTVPGCVDAGDDPVFVTYRMIARSVEPLRSFVASSVPFGSDSLADLRNAGVVEDGFFYTSAERRLVLPNFGR